MILTNRTQLPEPMFQFIANTITKPDPSKLRVTQLISAPLPKNLQVDHWEDLHADAIEFFYAAMGTAIHDLHRQHVPDNALDEERITIERNGVIITGQSDLYYDNLIMDYKYTSVWTYIFGDKPEWERQLNLYSWLFRETGMDADNAQIEAYFRDFSVMKSLTQPGYPPEMHMVIDIPIWTKAEQDAYVDERIEDHRENPYRECTPEEKWLRGEKWAVMKHGRKSAVKLHDTCVGAEMHIAELDGNHYIDHRPGEAVKCKSYCTAREVCPYATKSE